MRTRLLLTGALLLLAMAALLSLPAGAVDADGKIVVVLDPGHGGTSTGTCDAGKPEYYYNMIVAEACRDALTADGRFTVYLTHTDNGVSMEHWERLLAADAVNADCCISIHFNGNKITSLNGTETFISVVDRFSLPALAEGIQQRIPAAFGFKNLGVFARVDVGDETGIYYWDEKSQWDIPNDSSVGPLSDSFGIITWGCKFGIPSIIIEHCYMSNASDRKVVQDDGNLRRMGQLDAEAIVEFYTSHEHDWSAQRQQDYPSSCLYDGKASYICSVCRARRDTVSLAPAADGGHLWLVQSSVPATCTRAGSVSYYCRIAHNFIYKGREDLAEHTYTVSLPATGHDYVLLKSTAVTHTEDGVDTFRCTRCGDSYSNVTKAEGHTLEAPVYTPPTCTEAGGTARRCSVCGEILREPEAALGHAWQVVSHQEATCTADGVTVSHCTRCGEEKTETALATGHSETLLSETAPGCETPGAREFCCARCDLSRTEILPETGHDDRLAEELPPACTSDGVRRTVCARCGRELTEVLPAEGHAWQLTGETLPGCEAEGSRAYRCTRCGETRTESVPAEGHLWQLASETPGAGLFGRGEKSFVCTRDAEHEKREETPAWAEAPAHLALLIGLCAGALLLTATIIALLTGLLRRRKKAAAEPLPDRPAGAAETPEEAGAAENPTGFGKD